MANLRLLALTILASLLTLLCLAAPAPQSDCADECTDQLEACCQGGEDPCQCQAEFVICMQECGYSAENCTD